MSKQLSYWRENKQVLFVLLMLWAIAALGCTVVFTDWLDQFQLAGFRLGFWFNQQGSILLFVAIIFVYHFWMSRIEQRYSAENNTLEATAANEVDRNSNNSEDPRDGAM